MVLFHARQERYEENFGVRNRTIYRLVCNFAPGGNRPNESVYANGIPCTKCPHNTTCDFLYKSLCSKLLIYLRYFIFLLFF